MLTAFAGERMFGKSYGAGVPWVLALHGWRRDHADFDQVLGAPEIDAIALDLPGFGATPAPPEAWGSTTYADLVAEVLPEMAPRVVLAGHSFGGRVAVELAARCPDQVAGLVLTGAPLYRPEGQKVVPKLGYRVIRRLGRAGLVSEERLERARRRYGSADYRAATGVMRETLVKLLSETYDEAIAQLRCPVELVWGEQDPTAPLWIAERLAEVVPGAHLVVCPGVGHLTPVAAPGEVRAAIERLRP